MKLSELKLPLRAGVAEVKGGGGWDPLRNGSSILLPDEPESEFFPLQEGRQFLFVRNRKRLSVFRRTQTLRPEEYWFGGTDESPFLVELTRRPFKAFKAGGEPRFYDSLKPAAIRTAERIFATKAKRQGDIFAVPVAPSWAEIPHAFCINSTPMYYDAVPLFGTRHRLYNSKVHFGTFYWQDGVPLLSCLLSNFRQLILAKGTLRAPDHSPVELKEVHLLAQTEGLRWPDTAD